MTPISSILYGFLDYPLYSTVSLLSLDFLAKEASIITWLSLSPSDTESYSSTGSLRLVGFKNMFEDVSKKRKWS